MLRFENEGITISVKLPRTYYTVHMMATYDKDNEIYIEIIKDSDLIMELTKRLKEQI